MEKRSSIPVVFCIARFERFDDWTGGGYRIIKAVKTTSDQLGQVHQEHRHLMSQTPPHHDRVLVLQESEFLSFKDDHVSERHFTSHQSQEG